MQNFLKQAVVQAPKSLCIFIQKTKIGPKIKHFLGRKM